MWPFMQKRDHVPELVIGQNLSTICVLQFWDYCIFIKNHSLPIPFCERWVIHVLSIIHENHLLSATHHRPALRKQSFYHVMPCHHGNRSCCTQSVKKNTHSDSLLTKAINKDIMVLERGKSTKDAVNKSCWWSMDMAMTRAWTELRIVYGTSIQLRLSRNNVLLILQVFDILCNGTLIPVQNVPLKSASTGLSGTVY